MRRCVSCQHQVQLLSWILGTCVKAVLTLEARITGSFMCNHLSVDACLCAACTVQADTRWSVFTRFEEPSPPSCGFCHIPYDEFNMPFPAQLTYCYHCRRQKVWNVYLFAYLLNMLNMYFVFQCRDVNSLFFGKVPDVLFTTIDLPPEASVAGKGCLIQAR